jgi:glutaredoxin
MLSRHSFKIAPASSLEYQPMSVLTKPMLTTLLGLMAALAAMAPAHAQIFRIVGPDGKVTFSDKPPITNEAKVVPSAAAPSGAAGAGASLPFALRQVTAKYPVVLYTSAKCAPCDAARGYLSGRGVPMAEKTVSTQVDIEALQRLSGATTLPFMTIGAQQLKGFSESEWSQYLDAAGYPKSSQLPAGFKNPGPAPLVAAQKETVAPVAANAPAEAVPPPAPAPAAAPAPGPSNPAGIKF